MVIYGLSAVSETSQNRKSKLKRQSCQNRKYIILKQQDVVSRENRFYLNQFKYALEPMTFIS